MHVPVLNRLLADRASSLHVHLATLNVILSFSFFVPPSWTCRGCSDSQRLGAASLNSSSLHNYERSFSNWWIFSLNELAGAVATLSEAAFLSSSSLSNYDRSVSILLCFFVFVCSSFTGSAGAKSTLIGWVFVSFCFFLLCYLFFLSFFVRGFSLSLRWA